MVGKRSFFIRTGLYFWWKVLHALGWLIVFIFLGILEAWDFIVRLVTGRPRKPKGGGWA